MVEKKEQDQQVQVIDKKGARTMTASEVAVKLKETKDLREEVFTLQQQAEEVRRTFEVERFSSIRRSCEYCLLICLMFHNVLHNI